MCGRFHTVLGEGVITHRVQYMIEVLMQVRKDMCGYNPIVPERLGLAEEDAPISMLASDPIGGWVAGTVSMFLQSSMH